LVFLALAGQKDRHGTAKVTGYEMEPTKSNKYPQTIELEAPLVSQISYSPPQASAAIMCGKPRC